MAAADETGKFSEAHPMKGGDGPNSYANNSTLQRASLDAAKELLNKAIAEKLDIEILFPSNTFHIADLGCSVGPNTFSAVENIIEAVEFKFQGQGLNNSQTPEFQVFFNDHTSNDFNMLFKSLPQIRRYYAAGVPGSFYGRLFPNDSVHFFHSSYALQWLSRVPKAVVDKDSPAWNKGRIYYANSTDEVVRAYEAQHAEDMNSFLNARAQEIAYGGLMILLIPGRPNGMPHADHVGTVTLFESIGSCLMDMARKGLVSEEKVDEFNIPVYVMSPQELKSAVEGNKRFSLEKLETVPRVSTHSTAPPKLFVAHMRAGLEGLIKQKFGEEIVDEIFDSYLKKLEEQPSIIESGTRAATIFLAVLKRKEN